MSATDQLTDEVAAFLAPLGQRMTRQRVAVLTALGTERPLTADEIAATAGVPTSTTYRNVADLVDAGVLVRVAGADRIERFELAERFGRHHHHHLICESCGTVVDFEPSAALEQLIRDEVAAVGRTNGFDPSHHLFDIRGRCSDCA